MNSIDIKSLLIGALLTSTVIFGVAATGKTDTWDTEQKWEFKQLLVTAKGQMYETFPVVLGKIMEDQLKPEDIVSGWEPITPGEPLGRTQFAWAKRRVK